MSPGYLSHKYEPPHDKTNKMACAPSEDSDQHGHPPSLIRVFAVRTMEAWVISYPLSAQRRLWSDWVDAQADLSLRRAHMPFCWFYHEAAHILLKDDTLAFIRLSKNMKRSIIMSLLQTLQGWTCIDSHSNLNGKIENFQSRFAAVYIF